MTRTHAKRSYCSSIGCLVDSPLIDDVWLENPATASATSVDVGRSDDGKGGTRISGTEWMQKQLINGRSVRGFENGYEKNKQSVTGGTRHNVYLVMRLPEPESEDWFDFPTHRLIIRYKDIAPGNFALGVQVINSGDQLRFVPLRQGVLHMQGDGKWKTAVVPVRQQDMGWYKGPDYQHYEVEQLQRIAQLTNDWFFSQYVERHRYFLEANNAKKAVIMQEDSPRFARTRLPSPKIFAASPTYASYGFDNALDENAVDDYVAALENQPQAFVTLDFGKTVGLSDLEIDWENASNYAKQVVVSAVNQDGSPLRELARITAEPIRGRTRVPLANDEKVRFIRIDFSDFAGQPRLLLRLLKFSGTVSNKEQWSTRMHRTENLADVSNERKRGYREVMNRMIRWACMAGLVLVSACGGGGGGDDGGDGNTKTPVSIVAELNVVASSQTLSGGDLDTLVDGNEDDGIVDAELPFVFTVTIGRQAVIREIRLTWGSEQDYATDYTIEDVGYAPTVEAARRYGEIVSVSNGTGMIHTIDLRQNPARASFRNRVKFFYPSGIYFRRAVSYYYFAHDRLVAVMKFSTAAAGAQGDAFGNLFTSFRLP